MYTQAHQGRSGPNLQLGVQQVNAAASGDAHPPLRWPTPPYAAYGAQQLLDSPQPCEVEGVNSQIRSCLLLCVRTRADSRYACCASMITEG